MILILLSGIISAQRNTEEIISAEGLTAIQINTDEVYLITITASETSEVTILTHSEGEYFNDIILNSEVKDGKLILTSEYPQKLAGGFDKLSAHKVFSLEIEIKVPENMEILVTSNIASLIAKGNFNAVYADLKQGYCRLLSFDGTAVINTFKGDIEVEASQGLIEADSRHGKVTIPDFLPGRKPLRLTSIDGNIMVRKN